ncbi:MAG: polymer-forming cytoskeletal protein [Alphaproteobacteria bacterium]
MFHRVKSEVQDAEQEAQQTQSEQTQSEQSQDQGEEVRGRNSQDERENNEETISRSQKYSFTPSVKIQESEKRMEQKEDEQVQGKYAPVRSERKAEEAAPKEEVRSQRSAGYQPSVSRPAYAGPSYGSAYGAMSSQTGDVSPYSAGGADRTLTIGRGINMSGEIEACDHLLVEGTVEAALKGAKVLDIAESGTFYGTVEIQEATIAGRFEGDITVNGRLTLKSTGVITGSIAYRELEVEAGAVLDGRMTPLKEEVDQKSVDRYRTGTEASAMAKVAPKKDGVRAPVNTEGAGLFSKARASYQ